MHCQNNIIYIDEDFRLLCLKRQRAKVLLTAAKRFRNLEMALIWLVTDLPALRMCPEMILGTYTGFCYVMDAIANEPTNWSPDFIGLDENH